MYTYRGGLDWNNLFPEMEDVFSKTCVWNQMFLFLKIVEILNQQTGILKINLRHISGTRDFGRKFHSCLGWHQGAGKFSPGGVLFLVSCVLVLIIN